MENNSSNVNNMVPNLHFINPNNRIVLKQINKAYRTRNQKWTREQDQKLAQLVAMYGYNWTVISRQFRNKSGKTCRQRWINQLNPNIRWQPWTLQEQWILFIGVTLYGTRWCQIATMFQDRPDKHLKNYWHTTGMKKKVGQFKQILREVFLMRGLEVIRKYRDNQPGDP